jgi:hypothetical protein
MYIRYTTDVNIPIASILHFVFGQPQFLLSKLKYEGPTLNRSILALEG